MLTKLVCSSVSLTLGASCLSCPHCPHCRQLLVLYNKSENQPNVPAGSFALVFEQIHYCILRNDIIAAAVGQYERPPPPVRPPGFSLAAIRREWEAQRPC